MRERQDRLEEACEIIKLLFTAEELFDYEGRYYRLKQAPSWPKGIQQPHPPIMVGGKGRKRTLKTLAKYGDTMNVIAGPDELRELIGVLEGHCEAIGRDPAEIRKSVHVPMRIERDEGKARALRGDMDWQMIGPPDYVIDRARDFIAAGTQEFMLQMIPEQSRRFTKNWIATC